MRTMPCNLYNDRPIRSAKRPIAVVRSLCVALMCLVRFGENVFADDSLLVVKPSVTDELLANPGLGWETFHRTSKADKNLPAWIPSTVCYYRWSWRDLESQPDKLNTEFVDKALKEAHDTGQKLAFRIKGFSPDIGRSYNPAWLKAAGGRELLVDYNGSAPVIPIPDFDDPTTLKLQLDLIKQLGERYDGNPDLDHVDLGSVGWWGEWHMTRSKLGKMPAPENCQKLINAYLAAFKKTPLLMLIGAKEFTSYATQHGTGWRADSLGDLGTFDPKWNHMRNAYPISIPEAKIQDVWKTAPVAFEPPAEVSEFVEKKWPLRWIFNYGLALHGSYFNGKSGKLPNGKNFQEELTRFLRRLGYRLVLNELTHPVEAEAGGKLNISTKWQNVGSAPCYQPYRVAYRLANTSGYRQVIVSSTTVNHWLPGSIELFDEDFFKMPKDLPPGPVNEVADNISLPADLPPGEYTLSVAVVGATTEEPVIKLGIAGRSQDGWYALSKLTVILNTILNHPASTQTNNEQSSAMK